MHMITWKERVEILQNNLGRKPTFAELMEEAKKHKMTPEERQAQHESFVRGMMLIGDPRFD